LPTVLTSGGQSGGGEPSDTEDKLVVELELVEGEELVDLVDFFVKAAQSAKEVQERQGFPSFPSTTPLGNFLTSPVEPAPAPPVVPLSFLDSSGTCWSAVCPDFLSCWAKNLSIAFETL